MEAGTNKEAESNWLRAPLPHTKRSEVVLKESPVGLKARDNGLGDWIPTSEDVRPFVSRRGLRQSLRMAQRRIEMFHEHQTGPAL